MKSSFESGPCRPMGAIGRCYVDNKIKLSV
jgi:hypothetical protein